MFNGTRRVIGVWVFTAYDDGEVTVTQTAPDKRLFNEVKAAVVKIGKWCGRTIRDQDKCPYSPNNPAMFGDDGVNDSDEMS